MKTTLTSLIVAILSLVLFRCDDEAATGETIRLNFRINDVPEQDLSTMTAGTSLLVSIETLGGIPVVSSQTMSFVQRGDMFVSAPLDLQPGQYVITEVAIVDESGTTLFTVPRAHSLLAGAVKQPLPFRFDVVRDMPEETPMTLLCVGNRKPEHFGMKSFKKGISFAVIVTTPDGKHIPGVAAITKGTDTVATYRLAPKINHFTFSGNVGETYTLTVESPAYASFRESFTIRSPKSMFDKKTLRVVLQPALTIRALPMNDPEFTTVTFYLGGTGHIVVDWGDSTVETLALTTDTELTHFYTEVRSYPVTITGDLDQIVSFYSFYGCGLFSDVRFDHLVNMNEIRYGLTGCPRVIDLSHNEKLAFVMMPHMMNLEMLYLPRTHMIGYMDIDGANRLGTAEIDAIINNIYNNTVSRDIHDGIFSLRSSWIPDETNTLVGPPSEAAMIKLDLLRENYGWSIWQPGDPIEERVVIERRKMNERYNRNSF